MNASGCPSVGTSRYARTLRKCCCAMAVPVTPTEAPNTPAGLPRPSALAIGTRGVVDCVLEHAGDRAVVFGRNEQKALGALDFVLQPLDGLGLVRVVVLVVKRQVADLHLLERKLRGCQFYNGACQFAVERIVAKASDDNGDLVFTHDDLL